MCSESRQNALRSKAKIAPRVATPGDISFHQRCKMPGNLCVMGGDTTCGLATARASDSEACILGGFRDLLVVMGLGIGSSWG